MEEWVHLNLKGDEGYPTRQFVTKGNATICIRQKQYINKRIPQTKVSEKDRSLLNKKNTNSNNGKSGEEKEVALDA